MKLLACVIEPVRVPATIVTVFRIVICYKTTGVVCWSTSSLNPEALLPKVPAKEGLKIPMILSDSPVLSVLLIFWHSMVLLSGHTKVVMTWL